MLLIANIVAHLSMLPDIHSHHVLLSRFAQLKPWLLREHYLEDFAVCISSWGQHQACGTNLADGSISGMQGLKITSLAKIDAPD